MKILHISDLHFTRNVKSGSFSADQLEDLERVYKYENYDRVIVTGDITEDSDYDSFLQARSYLMSDMQIGMGKAIGLRINDDIKLKVVPGNKDNQAIPNNNKIPECYYDGLENYNRVFVGRHTFFDGRPILYDWFDLDSCGVFIVYINTSFFGSKDKKLKTKYVDYTCKKVKDLVNQCYRGEKEKRPGAENINPVEFRDSFKILVSHHSLFSGPEDKLKFLSKDAKDLFTSNLGLLGFHLQISGHGHLYDVKEKKYFSDIFDHRAKSRFMVNYFRTKLGYKNQLTILKSEDGRNFTKSFRQLLDLVISNVHHDYQDVVEFIEKLVNGETRDLIDILGKIIKSDVMHKADRFELEKVKKHVSQLSEEERKKMERNAKIVLSKLVKAGKNNSLKNFNTGSVAIPHNGIESRDFNIYEIESISGELSVICRRFKWDPNIIVDGKERGRFLEYSKRFIIYSAEFEKLSENLESSI